MNKLKEILMQTKDFKFQLKATVEASDGSLFEFNGTSDLDVAPSELKKEFEQYIKAMKSCEFINNPFKNEHITLCATKIKASTGMEEIVSLENYQKLAMRTCLPSARNWDYCYCEIYSELGEAFGKWGKVFRDKIYDKDKLTDELGDIFWGIALACDLSNIEFEDIWNCSPISLDNISIRFVLPNSYCAFTRKIDRSRLIELMQFTKKFAEQCGIKPLDCLCRNINKLSKRQKNNTLSGNGDNR